MTEVYLLRGVEFQGFCERLCLQRAETYWLSDEYQCRIEEETEGGCKPAGKRECLDGETASHILHGRCKSDGWG